MTESEVKIFIREIVKRNENDKDKACAVLYELSGILRQQGYYELSTLVSDAREDFAELKDAVLKPEGMSLEELKIIAERVQLRRRREEQATYHYSRCG